MRRKLLAVFAHPDDEFYRAGGTLALLAEQDFQVQVLSVTQGEWGIPKLPPEKARAKRENELYCACRALGILPPLFWDYPDGHLDQINEAKAVAKLTELIREWRPDTLLTWPPSGVSGHPDHQAVSRWTKKAFLQAANHHYQPGRLPAHPVSSLYYLVLPQALIDELGLAKLHGVPEEEITLQVDVSSAWDKKKTAILCHESQLAKSSVLKLMKEKRDLFFKKEYFKRIYLDPSPGDTASKDLLAHLK
ncbi:MAG: PIG-L deacetylase family protein [Anaerolineales bacterium]|nr:PIG-L deacetylase family protein [Anaerolineales bacterium]